MKCPFVLPVSPGIPLSFKHAPYDRKASDARFHTEARSLRTRSDEGKVPADVVEITDHETD